MNKLVTTVLVLQPQLKENSLQPLIPTYFGSLNLNLFQSLFHIQESDLDLFNVFVVKIVLLQSLQFIICIVFQSFHDLDLKTTKMKRIILKGGMRYKPGYRAELAESSQQSPHLPSLESGQ